MPDMWSLNKKILLFLIAHVAKPHATNFPFWRLYQDPAYTKSKGFNMFNMLNSASQAVSKTLHGLISNDTNLQSTNMALGADSCLKTKSN